MADNQPPEVPSPQNDTPQAPQAPQTQPQPQAQPLDSNKLDTGGMEPETRAIIATSKRYEPETQAILNSSKRGSQTDDSSQYMNNFFGSLTGTYADYFFNNTGAGRTLKAFQQSGEDAWGAAPFQKSLTAIEAPLDVKNSISSTIKGWGETYLRPVAAMADLAVSGLAAGMGGAGQGISEVSGYATNAADLQRALQDKVQLPRWEQNLKNELYGYIPDENTVLGGLGEIGAEMNMNEAYPGHPEYGQAGFLPDMAELPHVADSARAKGAIGETEGKYFGTEEPTPEDIQKRKEAAQRAGVQPTPPVTKLDLDIHSVARKVDPDAFNEYENKIEYQDELSSRLEDYPKGGEKSLEQVTDEEAFDENHRRLQELQGDINDAYKSAHNLLLDPEELAEYKKKYANEAPETPVQAEEAKAGTETPKTAEATPEAPRGLSDDTREKATQDIQNAGYSREYAENTVKLAESHYQAWADRFGGKQGTGEDFFKENWPEIRSKATFEQDKESRNSYAQYVGEKSLESPGMKSFYGDKLKRGFVEAKRLDEEGGWKSEDIRALTGWFKNPHDGKWRTELSDHASELTDAFKDLPVNQPMKDRVFKRLGDVLKHPELYARYPDLAEVKIGKTIPLWDTFQQYQGWYNDKTNEMHITPYAEDPHGTLLHEIQHWIQNREGFARGGGDAQIVSHLSPEQFKALQAEQIDHTITKQEQLNARGKIIESFFNNHPIEEYRAEYEEDKRLWGEHKKDPTNKPLEQEWLKAYRKYQKTMAGWMSNVFNKKNYSDLTSYEKRTLSSLEDVVSSRRDPEKILQGVANDWAQANRLIEKLRSGDPDALQESLDSEKAFAMYEALAGEMEARDTQYRRKLPPRDREALEPYTAPSVAKIKPEDVITSFKTEKMPSWASKNDRNRLYVARRFEDGTVQTGGRGGMHADLISDDEMHNGVRNSELGWVTPDGQFLDKKAAMRWAGEHQPDLNPENMGGPQRDKDSLESTGYEREMGLKDMRDHAQTKVPPYLEDLDREKEPYRVSAGGVAEEHRREVSDIEAQATRDFAERYGYQGRNDRALYQEEGSPSFYSALGRAVDNLDLEKASPDQWIKTLDNLKGVKKEEMKWSGIKQYLEDWKTHNPDSKEPLNKALVQLHLAENQVHIQEVEKYEGDPRSIQSSRDAQYPTVRLPGGQNYRELLFRQPENPYRSSHWKEGGIFAHTRYDDRVGPNGEKMLHLAEVQSDLHQAGKKEGYQRELTPEEQVEKQRLLDEHEKTAVEVNRLKDEPNPSYDKIKTAEEKQESLFIQLSRLLEKQGLVPETPFKNTWHELVMKRMLRYAAENGYDKLSWDTGATTAIRARQALQDIQEVRWNPETHQLGLTHTNGDTRELGVVAPEKLSGLLGHEIAEQLQTKTELSNFNNDHIVEGQNLVVGGKGNRKFYDEIIPQFMDKYVRQWGSKVEDIHIPTGREIKISQFGGVWKVHDPLDPCATWHDFPTREAAEHYIKEYKPDALSSSQSAHSVAITPEMKKSVMEGQPLFQGQKRGSLLPRRGLGQRNLLTIFQDAKNDSTLIHETGHQWLEELHKYATRADAPDDLKQDLQTVRDFVGWKPEHGNRFTNAQHERFARAFERYLRDGIAPNEELKSVFEKFGKWLSQVYQSVKDLMKPGDKNLTPEFKAVLDRMAAPEKGVEAKGEDLPKPEETQVNEEGTEVTHPKEGRPENEPTGELYQPGKRDIKGDALKQKPVKIGQVRPIKGATGRLAYSGMAKKIMSSAITSDLEGDFGDLPTYERLDMKQQAADAVDFVDDDPEEAKAVLDGKANPPSHITPEAILLAYEQHLTMEGDMQGLLDLAHNSPINVQIATIAQRLRTLAERDTMSPLGAISNVEDARDAYYQKVGTPRAQRVSLKNVTPAEAAEIVKRSRDANALKLQVISDPDNQELRMRWGHAKNDFTDYVNSLKPYAPKTLDYVADLLFIPKIALTGVLHMSALGVQAWGMASDLKTWTSVGKMVQYLWDEKNYSDFRAYVVSHPNYEKMTKAQLGVTGLNDKLTNMEEEIQANLAYRMSKYVSEKTGIPDILRVASRAFSGYLGWLRFQKFNEMTALAERLGHDTSVGSQANRDIALMINNFTGRGELGAKDAYRNVGPILNALLFAPRKLVASVEMFNPWTYAKPQNPVARNEAFRQIFGSIALTATVLSVAQMSGANVDWDPRSTKFGLINIGGEQIDITGGNRTYIRFLARMLLGQEKTSHGHTYAVGDKMGDKVLTRGSMIQDYIRGKLAPVASFATDFLAGTDPVGNTFDPIREAREKMTPIVFSNFIDYMEQNPKDTAALIPALSSIAGYNLESPLPPTARNGVTVWGDDVYRGLQHPEDYLHNPIRGRLDQEFDRLGLTPSFPTNTIRGVRLNDHQYHDYIKLANGLEAQVLNRLMDSDIWSQRPDAAKKKFIKMLTQHSRTQAQSMLLHQPQNFDLLQAIKNKRPGASDSQSEENATTP